MKTSITERDRQGCLLSVAYCSHLHNSRGWAMLKPGAWQSTWVSTWVTRPQVAVFWTSSVAFPNMLAWKWIRSGAMGKSNTLMECCCCGCGLFITIHKLPLLFKTKFLLSFPAFPAFSSQHFVFSFFKVPLYGIDGLRCNSISSS